MNAKKMFDQIEKEQQEEKERQTRIEGESFSILFTLAVGLLIVIWNFAHGIPTGDIFAMFWTTTFGCAAYGYLKDRRRKSQLCIATVSLALIVYNLIRYFAGI